jgi:hypothetical protein
MQIQLKFLIHILHKNINDVKAISSFVLCGGRMLESYAKSHIVAYK